MYNAHHRTSIGLQGQIASAAALAAKRLLSKAKTKVQKSVRSRASAIGKTRRRGADQLISAPAARQAVSRNFMSTKFGTAAHHDDFPEGGLRLTGQLPNVNDDALGLVATGTAASNGGVFSPVYNTGETNGSSAIIGVSPTAFVTNATFNTDGAGIFTNNSNIGPIGSIAQYFRYFRFRKLALVYEGEVATSQSGTVQFSYDRDLPSHVNAMGSAPTTQIKAATAIVERFPWWTASRVVPLINDMQANRSDRLWVTTAAGAGIATTKTNADLELFFQGSISGVTDVPATASQQILGRYRWEFVLDLYGFSPQSADSAITARTAKGAGSLSLNRRLACSREDKSDLSLIPAKLSRTEPCKSANAGADFKSAGDLTLRFPLEVKRSESSTGAISYCAAFGPKDSGVFAEFRLRTLEDGVMVAEFLDLDGLVEPSLLARVAIASRAQLI